MGPIRILLGLVFSSVASPAQQYFISTYAGGAVPPPVAARAVDVSFHSPAALAADAAGNTYFISDNSVFKLSTDGMVIRVAGSPRAGYSGDGGPATGAQLNGPEGVAVDAAGNLFIADTGNSRIRKVLPSGVIVTIAGDGIGLYSGDGGPAASAQIGSPGSVAVDQSGNVFLGDGLYARVRRIAPSGIITTIAGNGTHASSGDGGPATSAAISSAVAVTVDRGGNLFIADQIDNRVRRVSPEGIITTVAGTGVQGFSGDGGPATSAQLAFPRALAVDSAGRLFILQLGRVRVVSPGGTITTAVCCATPYGFSGDGGSAASAGIFSPSAVAVDCGGNLFITDTGNNRVRKVSPDGIINTVAGNGGLTNYDEGVLGDGGPATGAQLRYPWSVATANTGEVFIADTGNNRIRRVSRDGLITTLAGDGAQGFSGDNGPAVNAQLNGPIGLAADRAGNLFFIDAGNRRVRKISATGIISTVAGKGGVTCCDDPIGDGGPATSATLGPFVACNTYCGGLAVDEAGNLFIADPNYNRVRKVSPDGMITTVAGNGEGVAGVPIGDGGPSTEAELLWPTSVAVDRAGNLFIADPGNGRIRKVSPNGIITTVAASLSAPAGLALDPAGNLLVADPGWNFFTGDAGYRPCCDNRIRRIAPDGTITTVAGGVWGYSGDGGPATTAAFNGPVSVAAGSDGSVYVADSDNDVIRILRTTNDPVQIGAVVDAASQKAEAISPGKIVTIYGAGLGPLELAQGGPAFPLELGGAQVRFNDLPAQILYTSSTQVGVAVPPALSGTTAQLTVMYQGQASNAIEVPVAQAAPGLFTASQTGWGQAAAVNVDGTINGPANPVRIGAFVSLFSTGAGQDASAITVTVDGIPARIDFAGQPPGQAPGLLQVNTRIPLGVHPGGYVPVMLKVGDLSTTSPVWIAVVAN